MLIHGINSLPRGDGSTVRIGEHDYPVVRIGAQLRTSRSNVPGLVFYLRTGLHW